MTPEGSARAIEISKASRSDSRIAFLSRRTLTMVRPVSWSFRASIVLDVAHHMLRQDALFKLSRHGACEYRVFAGILEVASVARVAHQVDTAADGHIKALRAQLTSDDGAIEKGSFGIPA